jgi:hypothetical protein
MFKVNNVSAASNENTIWRADAIQIDAERYAFNVEDNFVVLVDRKARSFKFRIDGKDSEAYRFMRTDVRNLIATLTMEDGKQANLYLNNVQGKVNNIHLIADTPKEYDTTYTW